MYQVSKKFGHDMGLSACFRQHRATHSHCQYLHGYALAVELVFEAETLDVRNWVIDFGRFDHIKQFLRNTFDHKLLVAEDDPQKDMLCSLAGLGCADCVVLPDVGCEAFAKYIYENVAKWLTLFEELKDRVYLVCVRVSEHGANSASYAETIPMAALVDISTLEDKNSVFMHGLKEGDEE